METNPVIEAIDAYFGDTSRPARETLDALREAIDHAQALCEAIEADLGE